MRLLFRKKIEMLNSLSPVIPRNITRAKRIAKHLRDLYPRQQLSTCQTATAHLYGHKDWHALEEACKLAGAKSLGPFDGQLDDVAFVRRRNTQIAIVCKELGGIDPQADSKRPPQPASKASLTEQELLAHFAARNAQKHLRLEKAKARWGLVFATSVIDEIQPTAESSPEAAEYFDFLADREAEWLQQLPALLGQWWSVNVPHQPEVGDAIKSFKLNPHLKSSLLKFGQYWGTLSVHYANTIDWNMAMGVAYLLAERYGSIFVQQHAEFCDLVNGERPPTKDQVAVAMPDFIKQAAFAQREFFECYPRDDFASFFLDQPEAFDESARDVVEILQDPNSRRGTWSNDA